MDGRKRPALALQAASLLMVLVACNTASLALTTTQLDVCSMACCMREGHCCCSSRRAKVTSEHGSETINDQVVSRSCPEGCTTSSSSARLNLRGLSRPASHTLAQVCTAPDYLEPYSIIRDLIAVRSSSSRAPPLPANL